MKNKILFVCLFCSALPLSLFAQASAFDIAGTVKTQEKDKGESQERRRGEVQVEDEIKVLEINLKRLNPTVSGEVTVCWTVMIADMRGNLRPVTKGKKEVSVAVGINTPLTSEPFSVKTLRVDHDNVRRNDTKMEQEVEGYAILILNAAGEEIASKFQPKSLEEKARQVIPGK